MPGAVVASATVTHISDRLVVTRGSGKVLRDTVGEIVVNGDGFVGGAPGVGTFCADNLPARLQKMRAR